MKRTVETDYLVIGTGASGLAFADALLSENAEAEVTLVDRRSAPGGHWLDAYPFVRLHTPSAYYGVTSLPLGSDRVDETGENAGLYERATGDEVRSYFAEVAGRLARTGRARFLYGREHLGPGSEGQQIRDVTGKLEQIVPRRKVVDARYLEASIPATHMPSFDVTPGVRFVPVNDLPAQAGSAPSYTVLGAGKTAVDACTWLLDNGVEPEAIRWVRPRDAWFHDRREFQPLAQVGALIAGIAVDAEAAARGTNTEDIFARLEEAGRLTRIDPARPATMYRGTMLSTAELDALRQIENVVRLGRVRRIEADRIILAESEVETGADVLHVDCTALGLSNNPATPIFAGGRIVIQQVRHNSPCFNAALIAFVEAQAIGNREKNRLCPPNPFAASVDDWARMMTRTWRTEQIWLGQPELAGWVARSRLNLLRDLPDHMAEESTRAAVERFVANVGPALER
jgi:hypothetical protein